MFPVGIQNEKIGASSKLFRVTWLTERYSGTIARPVPAISDALW